jgi:hypothetical protein
MKETGSSDCYDNRIGMMLYPDRLIPGSAAGAFERKPECAIQRGIICRYLRR